MLAYYAKWDFITAGGKMAKIAGLAITLFLFLGIDLVAAKDCGAYLRLVDGVTVDRHIQLAPGEKCSFNLSNSAGPMGSLVITQRPAHGTASVIGPHRLSYVAARGYLGEDSFVYERRGLDTRNMPVAFPVRVLAKIVGK